MLQLSEISHPNLRTNLRHGKALVFARMNQLPLVVTGWTQFQLAPILHGGDWRLYWNYFHSVKELNWFKQAMARRRAKLVEEPELHKLSEKIADPTIYEFSKVPWSDYFGELKPHRETIRDALFELLTLARQRELTGVGPHKQLVS